MTRRRSDLVDPKVAGAYHCVSRCVRRSWLCGYDKYSKKDFEHRKQWVEDRIARLGGIFAVGIYAYAVMSNHLHIVMTTSPRHALREWSDVEIAARWMLLFPCGQLTDPAARHIEICADPERLLELRRRLCSLSWFMRCLNEWVAKKANDEDDCTGRFWEGRFKSTPLRDDKGFLAACTYVDLNPVRAGIAKNVRTSLHTGVRLRERSLAADASLEHERLMPLFGIASTLFPMMSNREYIELVDHTGRLWKPGKGNIKPVEPPALRRLGLDNNHWTRRVVGIGKGYWRVVGSVEDLIAMAEQLKQKFLRGIGFARTLLR